MPKMKGGFMQRFPGSWTFVLSLGYSDPDPVTGKRKLHQQWVTVRGTKQQAIEKRTEMLADLHRGELVKRTSTTLGEWLQTWLEASVKPTRRPGTYEGYKQIVNKHLVPALGHLPLQEVKPETLTKYFVQRQESLSRATLDVHSAILSAAFKSALRQGLVKRNPVALAEGKPKARDQREEAKKHCWSPAEAQTFLTAAMDAGHQTAALFALALDSGGRKGELCGLKWSDVDLDAATVMIDRTLLQPGREPVFGPTKTGNARTVDLNTATVRLLREHKRAQAELRMKNRIAYQDLGLVFAKEWGDLHGREDSLGLPLQSNNLGQREFARVIKAAKVRPIKFHGLRHTSATLLLAAGEPVHVVAARLGHKKVVTTLETYAHALPSHQQQAARTLETLLYGGIAPR